MLQLSQHLSNGQCRVVDVADLSAAIEALQNCTLRPKARLDKPARKVARAIIVQRDPGLLQVQFCGQ